MSKGTTNKRLRSEQTVKVDFYKVSASAGGPAAFRKALEELKARQGATRRIDVRGERIAVHHITQQGTIFEGEVGRLRSHDVPAIATGDCSTKDIELGEEEGITERTAFLFDSSTGILAVHTKREAVSASKIAALCDVIMQNREQYFDLEVQLAPDAQGRLSQMNTFKNFTVSYASAARSNIPNPDITTKDFLSSLDSTEGQKITISVHSGKKRQSHLSFQAVWDLLRSAASARGKGVKKLTVSGRGAADEKLAVDLIEDRMRSSTTIEIVGQSAPYEPRRSAVRKLYDEQRPNF